MKANDQAMPGEVLRSILEEGGLSRLEVVANRSTAMPLRASLLDVPRLLIGVSGQAHFITDEGSPRSSTVLGPHRGLYVPAGQWVYADPRRAYRVLGCIFYPDRTRLYLSRGMKREHRWTVGILGGEEYGALPAAWVHACLRVLDEAREGRYVDFSRRAAAHLLMGACAGLSVDDPGTAAMGLSQQRWQAIRHYLEEHLQQPLDRIHVAKQFSMHPNHLSRLFSRYTGQSFNHYVRDARLARAALLLTDPRLNIAEVAHRCGFSTPNYFIRVYRRAHGLSPGKSRNIKAR